MLFLPSFSVFVLDSFTGKFGDRLSAIAWSIGLPILGFEYFFSFETFFHVFDSLTLGLFTAKLGLTMP